MHITLTRQEAEKLLSEIELNYQQKAVPLIEEAKKLECEVKERAFKEWDELMGIVGSDRYREHNKMKHLIHRPYSPYGYPPVLDGFFRSDAYYRLKNTLSSGLGFEIKVDSSDMQSLVEDRNREYKLSHFGNVLFFKSKILLGEKLTKIALDDYKTGTGHDFYEKPEPAPAPVRQQEPEKPKSLFERLFGG